MIWCKKPWALPHSCISSVSSYSMSLIFCKNVISRCINKMLEPEFLLTLCGLHNSCRSRFCSSFGRVVTEKVTACEVGWIWMSPTLSTIGLYYLYYQSSRIFIPTENIYLQYGDQTISKKTFVRNSQWLSILSHLAISPCYIDSTHLIIACYQLCHCFQIPSWENSAGHFSLVTILSSIICFLGDFIASLSFKICGGTAHYYFTTEGLTMRSGNDVNSF